MSDGARMTPEDLEATTVVSGYSPLGGVAEPHNTAMVRVAGTVAVVSLTLPIEPHPQCRHRIGQRGRGGRPMTFEPKCCATFKAALIRDIKARLLQLKCAAPAFPEGPLELQLDVVFPCPKGDEREREGNRPRQRLKGTRPDYDNCAKSISDAANGLLWLDDGQVADARVRKWYAGQDEKPCISIQVRRATPEAAMLAVAEAARPHVCKEVR